MKLDFPGVNFNCSAVGVNVQCIPVVFPVYNVLVRVIEKKDSLFDRSKEMKIMLHYTILY